MHTTQINQNKCILNNTPGHKNQLQRHLAHHFKPKAQVCYFKKLSTKLQKSNLFYNLQKLYIAHKI